MPIAPAMAASADSAKSSDAPRAGSTERDPGAPIARDAIDPDLVKLARRRSKVGLITAAGLVFLSIAYLLRLAPDLRFARSSTEPAPVTVPDVLAGKVETEKLVTFTAEPQVSRAIRVASSPGILGYRVAPVRGSADRLWIVVSGDGWDPPAAAGYTGRLRKLDDLAFARAAREHAAAHPPPVFASASAVRAGFAGGAVATVAGDQVTLADRDAVALDVVDADAATIAASLNERLPDPAAWRAALGRAGITVTETAPTDAALRQVRFTVEGTVTAATSRLETAGLLAARVEPVTRHYQTTWGALRASPPAGFDVGGKVLPDAQLELIGLHVARGIPADAYALVTGELPDDYWYVTYITVALAAILLVFAWALVRAVRRDLVPARAA
jgi:hypothetical protein